MTLAPTADYPPAHRCDDEVQPYLRMGDDCHFIPKGPGSHGAGARPVNGG
jgi:hypothetical protein